MKKFAILFILPVLVFVNADSQSVLHKKLSDSVRVLLLMDDDYGANYNVDDESMNIDELIISFGWDYDIAGIKDTLHPCETARPGRERPERFRQWAGAPPSRCWRA